MGQIEEQTPEWQAERIAYLADEARSDGMFPLWGFGGIYRHPASSDFIVVYGTDAPTHINNGYVCTLVAKIAA